MLKRLRLWTYLALATGASLFLTGCSVPMLWNTNLESWTRILMAYLREDIGG